MGRVKQGYCFLVPLLALSSGTLLADDEPAGPPSFAWERTETSLALHHQDKTVWRLVFDPGKPKSHFHPLATLDGRVLTAYEPADHPWHRGLWWSWKYINGVNYWEESRKTGQSDGLTRIVRAKVEPAEDFSARVELDFHYHPPEKDSVLTERRHLAISRPDAVGTYMIDWKSVFTAGGQPVKLDRTLPAHLGGVHYGGYAGLSLRMAKGLDEFTFRTSGGATTTAEAHGKPARWVDIAGTGPGITILDHPDNPRHEPPWYLHSGSTMLFFGPAPLFNEPLELDPGQSICFIHRVMIHSKPMTHEQIEEAWRAFIQSQPTNP